MFPQNLLQHFVASIALTLYLCYTTSTSNFGHDIFIMFQRPWKSTARISFLNFIAFSAKNSLRFLMMFTHSPATLSAPALAQVACTPGKCYGTSEFLTNPFCIEFIFIQFLYCLFILTMLKYIQKVFSLHLLREERYGNYQQDN